MDVIPTKHQLEFGRENESGLLGLGRIFDAQRLHADEARNQHECRCQVVDRLHVLQLRTTKINNLSISGTRFFGGNLMTVLKSDRQKELKNGVFMLFPRVFGHAKNLSKFFCILHHHLSQSLRKILLIKLNPITLCMSISSPESSASLASFFLCNWCDSRDLMIISSSSSSLTV